MSEQLVIAGVRVSPSHVHVSRGRKYQDDRHWVLTTRRGGVIAVFPAEKALDEWWEAFQRSQSRTPRPLLPGRPPPRRTPLPREVRTPSGGKVVDPLRPWSEEFDMPEFDAE
jgi:hypothetical protein